MAFAGFFKAGTGLTANCSSSRGSIRIARKAGRDGQALFSHLAKIAKENDCARVDWSVLKWNQPSIDFYQKTLNAVPMEEWQGTRLEGSGIDALEIFITDAQE